MAPLKYDVVGRGRQGVVGEMAPPYMGGREGTTLTKVKFVFLPTFYLFITKIYIALLKYIKAYQKHLQWACYFEIIKLLNKNLL